MTSNTGPTCLSLIVDGSVGAATRHGLKALRRTLQAPSVSFEEVQTLDVARGDTLLVAGLSGSPAVTEMLRAAGIEPPQGAESTLIQRLHWQDKTALLISGGDDRGLMYALLDVTDRIGWAEDAADPLSRVRDARESPYVAERSLSIYTMHKAHFMRRFHDEAYWDRYLDMLARDRFNTFALLFAYESAGLFAPPYPYFFDVPGFPDVRVVGLDVQEQARNLRSLNRLIAMVHERGLDFTLGIWDHVGLCGHWRDELAALRAGLEALREQRSAFRPLQPDEGPRIAHVPVHRAQPGEDMVVRVTVSGSAAITRVRVGYGREANEIRMLELERSEPYLYQAVIPGQEVVEGLRYWIEVLDDAGRQAAFPEGGRAHPLSVTVTGDHEPPTVVHEPICTAPAGQPLTVTARVCDPSGVRWVRLRYRSVTQFQDFCTLEMLPTGRPDEYQATVPGEHLDPGWDFMYLIEAMDVCGNGTIYPDLEVETPYVVVRLGQT